MLEPVNLFLQYQLENLKSVTSMTAVARETLIDLISEVLGVPVSHLFDDSSPENVEGWDSVKSMEIMTLLEETFSIQFSAEEIGDMTSIKAIFSSLNAHGVNIA